MADPMAVRGSGTYDKTAGEHGKRDAVVACKYMIYYYWWNRLLIRRDD